jgi:hypothetical protein
MTSIRDSLKEIVPTYNFKQSDSEKLEVAEEWAKSTETNGHHKSGKNGARKKESVTQEMT